MIYCFASLMWSKLTMRTRTKDMTTNFAKQAQSESTFISHNGCRKQTKNVQSQEK